MQIFKIFVKSSSEFDEELTLLTIVEFVLDVFDVLVFVELVFLEAFCEVFEEVFEDVFEEVFEEFASLKDKYEEETDANQFNLETLDLFLKYHITDVNSVETLI